MMSYKTKTVSWSAVATVTTELKACDNICEDNVTPLTGLTPEHMTVNRHCRHGLFLEDCSIFTLGLEPKNFILSYFFRQNMPL
jgi:hypothetical protein